MNRSRKTTSHLPKKRQCGRAFDGKIRKCATTKSKMILLRVLMLAPVKNNARRHLRLFLRSWIFINVCSYQPLRFVPTVAITNGSQNARHLSFGTVPACANPAIFMGIKHVRMNLRLRTRPIVPRLSTVSCVIRRKLCNSISCDII